MPCIITVPRVKRLAHTPKMASIFLEFRYFKIKIKGYSDKYLVKVEPFFYGAEEDANEYGASKTLELLPDGGDILLRDAISSKTYKQLSF